MKNLIGREHSINNFTIACELDMINVICAADITFIMSSSTSAMLLKPLGVFSSCRNKMTECFTSVSEDKLCEKCIIKQLLNSVFALCLCYLPQPSASADNTDLGFDNS